MKFKLRLWLIVISSLFFLKANSSTITVTNTNDSGAGSFRNAIASSSNGDVINFNITTGSAPYIITLTSSAISFNKNNLTIDGTTQTGYSCGTPAIILDLGGVWPAGFTVQGTGNTIKGISFRNVYFTFDGGGSHYLYGCWFNLNNNGSAVSGNNMDQNLMRFINGTTGNVIGGPACDTRNVFSIGGSTDTWQGVIRVNTGCNNNTFRGNYFGTDKSGMTLLNQVADHIIYISGSTSITLDQNVIAGANPSGASGGAGVYCDGTSVTGLTITGNYIGVRSDGTDGGSSWGNAYGGVAILAGTCNNFTFNNNVTCRNGLVSGSDIKKCGLYTSATGTTLTIKNNYVGVTPTYQKAGNYFAGIFINGVSSSVTINNNIIGDNGSTLTDNDQSHGLSLEQPCTTVSITNNYVGATPTGADIGNYCSGITVSGGSGYTITGNYIGFNKGMRTGIPNAGIVFTSTTDVVIQGNTIGGWSATGLPAGQKNGAVELTGGMGIFISGSSARFRIGGMNTGEQNVIAYNRSNGIAIQTADYIEMRWNKLYCNGLKGIELHYGTATQGNSGFGNGTVSITRPVPTLPTSLSGSRPTNSIVDVFGTNSCASSSSCIAQGEYRYQTGTYTPSASGVAGTSWSYNNGSAMYDDLSALATGGGTDCNSGYCRTSEFSPCVDNQLPITLVFFDAVAKGNTVELLWQTSEEKNSDIFEIERTY